MPLDSVEEAIFHAASELVDAQARAAFLNRAYAHAAGLVATDVRRLILFREKKNSSRNQQDEGSKVNQRVRQ